MYSYMQTVFYILYISEIYKTHSISFWKPIIKDLPNHYFQIFLMSTGPQITKITIWYRNSIYTFKSLFSLVVE